MLSEVGLDVLNLSVLLKLGAVLVLVGLNGFFVASEFAIVKVRSSQLEALEASGDRKAKLAIEVTKNLEAYLSATQLGITLASLGLGWVGEDVVAGLISPVLRSMGFISETVSSAVSIGVAFASITFLHIVLGELAPKSLAISKPVPTTLWVAPRWAFSTRCFVPRSGF